MTLTEFAQLHGVCHRRNECAEQIIPGCIGHIYEHIAGTVGVLLMFALGTCASFDGRTSVQHIESLN